MLFSRKTTINFFFEIDFRPEKMKNFRSDFFLRTNSDFRKSIGSSFRAYNPRHQNQKKVAEKVREIPNPKLTGLLRPRELIEQSWRGIASAVLLISASLFFSWARWDTRLEYHLINFHCFRRKCKKNITYF